MRIFSVIVLLLWTVCFGRYLKERYGGNAMKVQPGCEHQCCQQEKSEVPAPESLRHSGDYEFLQSGTVLSSEILLSDAPLIPSLPIYEPSWLSGPAYQIVQTDVVEMNTGRPPAPAM